MSDKTTVQSSSDSNRQLPLTKIYWGDDSAGKSVQITLTQNYGGQNLGILTRLFNIAKEDFPNDVKEFDDVAAVALGGDRRKGMWGIEFHVSGDAKLPKGYEKSQSEYILSGGL